MTHLSRAPDPDETPSRRFVRVAGWCAYASGIVSIFGIVFLVALYVSLFAFGDDVGFGRLNDISVIVHYTLTLPIALALRQLLRPYGPALSLVALLLGIAGMFAAVVLQVLLVTDVLSFAQQIGMVIPAFMVVMAWFVINGYLGRSTNKLPKGMLLHVLAGLYFGYPVWAFSLGRRLRALGP